MLTVEEFEAELDSSIVDLENLAAEAPEPFRTQMQSPLTALTMIREEVGNAVDEEQER